MRNLLNFLIRFNNLIIFIILEGITFYLLATGNDYHNTRITHRMRGFTQGIETKINTTRNYLSLREINKSLGEENVALKSRIERLGRAENLLFFSVIDTIYSQKFSHTSADVIENSVNRQKNFFTINKGRQQGISIDMAVTSYDGVAGVIVGCSDNYSVAMSLLNLDFRLSVRIRSNGYFGSLSWDGRDYRRAILGEIPQHISVSVGDTIETTGYSAIFPEGLTVGTISNFEKRGGDFYRITVLLGTEFKKLHYVDIVGNLKKTEEVELEKQFK